ncbi:MAG: trypco2 family protein [Deinococcota bacterium]
MSQNSIPIKYVVSQIELALEEGLMRYPTINLEKIDLELNTVIKKGAGINLELAIPLVNFEVGANSEAGEEKTQTLRLSLVPSKKDLNRNTNESIRDISIQDELTNGIRAIAELIDFIAAGRLGLTMESSSVNLAFVFTTEGKISVLTRVLTEKEVSHSITLYFESKNVK